MIRLLHKLYSVVNNWDSVAGTGGVVDAWDGRGSGGMGRAGSGGMGRAGSGCM